MKKKITKIILAVCLVVAGLPLFAIGARANDDANTNSEMMISVDNYFDYRNAKLMTASFGAGYTADSMDYPALVCNDVEAPAMAMEAKTNTDLRTSGMMDYFESCKLHLLSWEAFTGEPQDITTMENGLVSCKVYEWVEYTWYNDDFPDPVSSGFGTWHTLTLAPNAGDTSYQIVQDIYDESDISGFNNTVSKANDFDNEILPHYDTRGNVSTFSALASSFSRSAAVSYADAYVGNYSFSSGDVADYTYYNKQYKNFNASGGDCANYVSQCLKAAGLGTTSNWYYNNNGSICTDSTHDARVGHTCTNTHICGEAWRRSTELRKELSSYYASTFDTDPSPDSFCVADVGFFGRGATQSHSVICVATGGNSFLINSHNNDRKRVEYNARTIASNSLSRLHIHSGNSWTKYNATYHRGLCNGGCGEFVLAQHYARTPGSNATCLGCGYVGNISIGLMSMGDKLS